MTQRLYTADEAAAELGITPSGVRHAIVSGRMEAYKIKGKLAISEAELDAYKRLQNVRRDTRKECRRMAEQYGEEPPFGISEQNWTLVRAYGLDPTSTYEGLVELMPLPVTRQRIQQRILSALARVYKAEYDAEVARTGSIVP